MIELLLKYGDVEVIGVIENYRKLYSFKFIVFFLSQVRPPGHHAGVRQAMGFCLHNNAAVAALAAQVAGAKKVLIVDWVVCTLYCILLRMNVSYTMIS